MAKIPVTVLSGYLGSGNNVVKSYFTKSRRSTYRGNCK